MAFRDCTWLAFRDWLHDRSLTVSTVIALTSIILPVLIVYGVCQGIISSLKERLLTDPAVLVVLPAGSRGAGFDEKFLATVGQHPSVEFVIGRTRDIAAEIQLTGPTDLRTTVSLEALDPRDPLMKTSHLGVITSDQEPFPIALSAAAARKLGAKAGQAVHGRISRRSSNRAHQSKKLNFEVRAVLPAELLAGDVAFMPMPVLLAIQDFRDNIDSPLLGITGEHRAASERFFESFRLYAKKLEDVELLDHWFNAQDIPVKTRAKEIASLRRLNQSLSTIFYIVGAAAALGFIAFIFSWAYGNVQRKEKMLGTARMLGFTKFDLKLFPLVQSGLTSSTSCLLAFLLYAIFASFMNWIFMEASGGYKVCSIALWQFPMIFLLILLLTAIASAFASQKASSVEPSTLLRQV